MEVVGHIPSVGDLSAFAQVSRVARERLRNELFLKAMDPRVKNVNRWRTTNNRRHLCMRDHYLTEATVLDSPALEELLNQCSNPDVEVKCNGQWMNAINVLAPCSPVHLEDLFLDAVHLENETTAGILIERGVPCGLIGDENARLHNAVFQGSEFLLRLLLNRGEDVNQRDNQLRTALFIAAMRRLPNMVAMLLDFGAVVDMRIQGKTALRGAVDSIEFNWSATNYDDLGLVVERLMAAGADATGSGALHKAAVLGDAGLVELMIHNGANPAERCTVMDLSEIIASSPATALECFEMQVYRARRENAYIRRHRIATPDAAFYAEEEEVRRLLTRAPPADTPATE